MAKILPNKIEDGHYEYQQKIASPFVYKRDYTIMFISTKADTQWKHSRTLDNDIALKKKSDLVRVKINEGIWTLKKLGSNKPFLTYWLYTNLDGSTPVWVANKANNGF